ncbi:type IV pili methyl-accepting chemotaxis transducer N-terminal domain-containing protein, partial [Arthrospira platensis SPKY2]
VQGSGSAINVAGSLRRLTHRVSALVVADALDDGLERTRIDEAIAQLETSMAHPALLQVLKRDEAGAADAIYRGVISKWHAWVKPELLSLVERRQRLGAVADADEYLRVLADVDEFVEQLNTLVAVLEHDAEARIAQLRTILAVALFVVAMVVIAALTRMRRREIG